MRSLKTVLSAVLLAGLATTAAAADLVRLGNLKFAHYGAISYMKEIAHKYDLKIEERVFAKGLDIVPAIIAGEIDIAASAADAAIAGRAGGAPVYAVAGFAKGGARLVVRPDLPIKSVKNLKGKKVGVARGGAQELLLLAELAQNAGRLMLYEELLGRVWGPEYRNDVQLLRTWISRLRSKVEQDVNHPEIIQTVAKTGYIIDQPSA